jgi:hypothetical protein
MEKITALSQTKPLEMQRNFVFGLEHRRKPEDVVMNACSARYADRERKIRLRRDGNAYTGRVKMRGSPLSQRKLTEYLLKS